MQRYMTYNTISIVVSQTFIRQKSKKKKKKNISWKCSYSSAKTHEKANNYLINN